MSLINHDQLLQYSKDYIEQKNYDLAELYLNIFFLSKCEDSSNIVSASSLKSFIIHSTKKNLDNLINISELNIENYDSILKDMDNSYSLVRILYRTALSLNDQEKPFTAMNYIKYASEIFESTLLKKTQKDSHIILNITKDKILDKIDVYIDKVKKNVNEKKLDHKSLFKLFQDLHNEKENKNGIKNDIDNETSNDNNKSNTEKTQEENTEKDSTADNTNTTTFTNNMNLEEDKVENPNNTNNQNKNTTNPNLYYILSQFSLEKIQHFLKNENIHYSNLYLKDNIFELYYHNNTNYLGIFPGKIDNSILLDFVNYWKDPNIEEDYTNVYIKNGLCEKEDFVFFSEKNYSKIKACFDSEYDIPRYFISNKDLIEQNLRKFRLVIFCPELKQKNITEINCKLIQISKFKTVEELKNKIIRCLENVLMLNINMNLNINKDDDKNNKKNKEIITPSIATLSASSSNMKLRIFNEINSGSGSSNSNNSNSFSNNNSSIFDMILSYGQGEKKYMCSSNNLFNLNEGIESNTTNNNTSTDNNNIENTTSTDTNTPTELTNLTNTNIQSENKLLIEELNYSDHDILICEINCSYLFKSEKIEKCGLCNEEIKKITGNNNSNNSNNNNNTKFLCKKCKKIPYCSESCLDKDYEHINYHKRRAKYYKQIFNLENLYDTQLNDLLDSNFSCGKTGLKNLGNTCFINSAIQCLSHCTDLTKYFLTNSYESEINTTNKLGTGGNVAKAYSSLIAELWTGNSRYLSPWDFRRIFIRFARQFNDFSQNDSQEMLGFVLDRLHEDLNRIKSKPYISMDEQKENETEKAASYRWWNNHQSRENSIIVDLFHGQYKSIISCPQCKKKSITYDSFMCLSLPIPSVQIKISTIILEYNTNINADIKNIDISINEHTTVLEFLHKVDPERFKYFDLVLITSSTKAFRRIANENERITNLCTKDQQAIIYCKEKENISTKNYTFYFSPVKIASNKSFFGSSSRSIEYLSYPFGISVSIKNTLLSDVLKKVVLKLKEMLNLGNNTNTNTISLSSLNQIINLHVINTLPEIVGIFTNCKDKCEFCEAKCEYCLLNINQNINIENILAKKKIQRSDLAFYVEVLKMNNTYSNNSNVNNFEQQITKKSNVSVYDCLELFRQEEKLEKDNTWYCFGCKKYQEAYKKMQIFKVPKYLILHFKRFRIKSNNSMMGMLSNKKIDIKIDYPLVLNMLPYVVDETDKHEFELCAISQHYGSLSSGHYTALCNNNGTWLEFDDETVSRSNNIVTNSAYLLFYKMK